jgi:hypothetical protein
LEVMLNDPWKCCVTLPALKTAVLMFVALRLRNALKGVEIAASIPLTETDVPDDVIVVVPALLLVPVTVLEMPFWLNARMVVALAPGNGPERARPIRPALRKAGKNRARMETTPCWRARRSRDTVAG